MLVIFMSDPFYSKYVRFPDGSVLCKIWKNPKWWPFFKDAIGALDGSHIHVTPKAVECPIYHNCKGFVSQNCLFACDFDLNFMCTLTGWEGLATDARVYEDACSFDFCTPAGKYFLADAGYPLCPRLLVPYRSMHYHLAKWGRANAR
jgi:hypothetical protein